MNLSFLWRSANLTTSETWFSNLVLFPWERQSSLANYNFPDISLRPTQLLFDMFVKHIKSFTNNVLLISISRQSSVWLGGSIKNRKSAAKSKIYKQTPFTLYFSHVAMVHSVSS